MNRLTLSLVIVLALSVVTSLTVMILQQRTISSLHAENAQLRQSLAAPASSANRLVGVRKSDIPGRYRWILKGEERGVITLTPDQTMLNLEGKANARYYWYLQRDGLVVTWATGYTLFTESPEPGHYIAPGDGPKTQMIKVE